MSGTPLISIGIIARERIPELESLVARLTQVEGPAREIVVGVETPGAEIPTESVDELGVRWLALPAKRGLAYNRNRVLDAARGDILVQVDDDCVPEEGWLDALLAPFDDPATTAASGGVDVPSAGFVGDSISALGFPAGASAGFETMFRVEPDGTTDNLTTCNCAFRTETARRIGGFDEILTHGGEDTELAHRIVSTGGRIMYVPTARVTHPARTSLREFGRWFYRRGRAKKQFSRRVPMWGYVRHRLGSYGHILRAHVTDPKILLIAPLLVASVFIQYAGFLAETLEPSPTIPQTVAPVTGENPAREG